VKLQDINVVGSEPPQAGLEIGADAGWAQVFDELSAGTYGPALREEERFVASTAKSGTDERLATTPAVERRRVDPVDARGERGVDCPHRAPAGLASPPGPRIAGRGQRSGAEAHSAEGKLRHRCLELALGLAVPGRLRHSART
jgi:hypothetical protein